MGKRAVKREDGRHYLMDDAGPCICPFGNRLLVPVAPNKFEISKPGELQMGVNSAECHSGCPFFNVFDTGILINCTSNNVPYPIAEK